MINSFIMALKRIQKEINDAMKDTSEVSLYPHDGDIES
jgi:hypothetical protein